MDHTFAMHGALRVRWLYNQATGVYPPKTPTRNTEDAGNTSGDSKRTSHQAPPQTQKRQRPPTPTGVLRLQRPTEKGPHRQEPE